PAPRQACFAAEAAPGEVFSKQQILAGVDCALLDARGKGRFEATEPEPRPGLAGGHIPGARHLPFGQLYREDGTLQSPEARRRLAAPTSCHAAAISSSWARSDAGPLPNGSTSRSAWRMLARRDSASA